MLYLPFLLEIRTTQQSTTSKIRPVFRYEKTPSVVCFKDNNKL